MTTYRCQNCESYMVDPPVFSVDGSSYCERCKPREDKVNFIILNSNISTILGHLQAIEHAIREINIKLETSYEIAPRRRRRRNRDSLDSNI